MEDGFPTEWLRGLLEPCLLALLDSREAYGHQLAKELDAAGLGRIAGGSLYPALLRLEQQGLLVSDWRAGDGGPGRKYYALTPAGQEALRTSRRRWESFADTVAGVLSPARSR